MNDSRFDPRRQSRGRGGIPQGRMEQAKLAREAQVEQHARQMALRTEKRRAEEELKTSLPVRDAHRYRDTLTAIPFSRLGEVGRLTVSDVYSRLMEISVRCMNDRSREAVFCWPHCDPSPAAAAIFLALADASAVDPMKCGGYDALSAPLGVRALIYPYARTAHRALRHVYIDKDYIARLHTNHQLRSTQPGEDQALADYHMTLARAKTLTGVALDGETFDEFRHPCLDEIMPSGPCRGAEGRSELLWRVRTKTDLRKITRSGKADDPAGARFYLFGLRASELAGEALKALKGKLDIVFLDLSQTSRNRLGREWLPEVRAFLEDLDARLGPVATVALTDDPWTFDKLRFEGLVRAPQRKGRTKPEASSIIFASQPDLVVSTQLPPITYSEIGTQDVIGFSGEVESLLRRIRSSTTAAIALNDRATVDTLQRLAGTIRRCASLPGSREHLSAYVEREVGGLAAADLLSSYRVGSLIAELKSSLAAWPQHDSRALLDLCADITRVWENTAELTPMAPLLRDVVQRFLRVSSRTAILFRNDMLADFAAYTLRRNDEIGESVNGRIDKNMLLFLERGGLDDLVLLSSPQRNQIRTLIAVAPTRPQILELLARAWLPHNLIVLADSDTLAHAARDAARLAGYPELQALGARMKDFADRAAEAVHRKALGGGPVVEESDAPEDVEFPASSIVNLAGTIRPDQSFLRFKLQGDQVLIARPGTKLILQDRSRTIPLFTESEARNVDEGDRVCVVGDAFLEMARPLLNITARAAEEIRDYHQLVTERFARLPGATTSERLAELVAAMGLIDVTTQRAGYWIDLEEQLDAPLHEVVPHAPRDRATFIAFMRALSVSEAIASRFWTWAVIAQRASRVRAAMSFHDAYHTILIDNYAAQSSNPDRARDTRRLKAAAEDFVAVVLTKDEQRGERDRA